MSASTSDGDSGPRPIDVLLPMIFCAIFGALLFGVLGASVGAVFGVALGAIVGSRESATTDEST